jgi:hypothetical protein
MANEIQKWIPMEVRIAELRRFQQARRLIETPPPVTSLKCNPGEVVDLLRFCALHDRPYVARYIQGGEGSYRFSQAIQVTRRSHRDQYERNAQSLLVNSRDLTGDEVCAWCRARGEELGFSKSIWCGNCHCQICFGRTTADGYFHCRTSCGSEGQLGRPTDRPQQGFRPEIRDGF